jgi:hypothetical protein
MRPDTGRRPVPEKPGRRDRKAGAPPNVQRAAIAIHDAAEIIQQAAALTDAEVAIILSDIQQVYVRRAASQKDGRS